MPDPDTKRLFDSAFDYGKTVRLCGYDGKTAWDAFKRTFDIGSSRYTLMRESYLSMYNEVGLSYYSDEDDRACAIRLKGRVLNNLEKDGTLNELNHFVIQAFRIPYLESFRLSRMKVAQIGYNLGQCYASISQYPYSIQVWMSDSNLFDYHTYFEEE